MHDTTCLFCKIIAKQIPSKTAYEDDDVYAFHDIKPCGPVHVLVVPKKHIAKVADVTVADDVLMGKLVRAANAVAEKAGIARDGYRLVFNNGAHAGQEVFHLHLHVIGGRRMTWPPG